jgi:hypothetical protein
VPPVLTGAQHIGQSKFQGDALAKKKAKRKSGVKSKKRKQSKAKRQTRTTLRSKAKPKTARAQRKSPKSKAAKPRIGSLPSIELETTSGGRLSLADLKGKNVVLYFYPKDDTPGCTTEGCDIRDHFAEFTASPATASIRTNASRPSSVFHSS